jgi:transcriptional regulator GlxA family with amidase domain
MKQKRITRRELLQRSAAVASVAAVVGYSAARGQSAAGPPGGDRGASVKPLIPPAGGTIRVAFPISKDAILIDLAGPWEVFLNAATGGMGGSMDMTGKGGFQPYTVAQTSDSIASYGGMRIVPDHTFENSPPPKVIVIAAQGGDNDEMVNWIRAASRHADLTMSICVGAFTLAKTGLLSGKAATTHHSAYKELAKRYPDIRVKRGYRFVDEGNIASSGGLTCGIDLAFHVVERYWGRDAAARTALNMEYQGKGWLDASGADNATFAKS